VPIPLLSPFAGESLEELGGAELGVAAVTTGAIAIPARDELLLLICITGYSSGGDIASLRFNGDAGSNYSSRYLSAVAGGTTLVTNQNVSQTLARMFALATNLSRHAVIGIKNKLSTPKVGSVNGQTGVTSAATGLQVEFGGFQWHNTAAQITSVEMRTAGGSVTMSAGSSIKIFGCDTP
jgi:hypothetical protein